MNDLAVLPKGHQIPPRPTGRHRGPSNALYVASGDFAYMEKTHFNGYFTIPNAKANGRTVSERLAVVMDGDCTLLLIDRKTTRRAMTASPCGDGWATVVLKTAFKTEDGRFCVIEIAPMFGKGGAE